MALAFVAVIKPKSWFAEAAEYLMAPNALIKDLPNGNLNLIPLIGKFSIALWVCAPQSAFLGTLTSPRLSCSIRKDCFFVISFFFYKLYLKSIMVVEEKIDIIKGKLP